ncbi:hypothetical protein H9P43_008602 [Blastocladiella emersonii ATCC 22665]|nr:hypothetical protein H9P43_008602 [Blastocladiella emersonii ATCC 22665]
MNCSSLPLLPATVLDRILCHAVRLLDPDDVAGMQRYSRVMLRDDAPCVHRAIVDHATSISIDEASANGQLNVLDAWVRSGKPLEYTGAAITGAARSYKSLDWWRRSGLSLPECEVGYMVQVHFNGTCDEEEDSYLDFDLEWYDDPPGDFRLDSMLPAVRDGTMEEVWCVGMRITEMGASAFADAMTEPTANVVSVDLECCDLTYPLLHALRLPASVTELELKNNWAGEGAAELADEPSPFPPHLARLVLTGNIIGTPADAEVLFRALPASLTELRLPYIPLSGEYARVLARHFPPVLTELALSGCELGSDGLAVLAPHFPRTLKWLGLGTNGITADGAAALAAHFPPALEDLGIGDNPLGDAGLAALAAGFAPSVKTLWLDETCATDAGIKALMDNIPPNLKDLSLSGAMISSVRLEAVFAQIPSSLTGLCLADCVDPATGELPDVAPFLPGIHPGLQVDME